MTDLKTVHWTEIPPDEANQAIENGLFDIEYPMGELGEPCPWPWEPQQLKGAPLGMYHCPYCGTMVVAGTEHTDYKDFDKHYEEWCKAQPDYDKWVEEDAKKREDAIKDGISV